MRYRDFFLLLLALLLMGCNKKSCILVTQAEELLKSDTDSAYSLLQSIDTEDLSKKDDAKYRVVLSVLCHKTHRNINQDSLIRPAIEYYQKKGTPDELALAKYCLAQTQIKQGKIKESTQSYLEVLSLLGEKYEDKEQQRLAALSYHNLAALYFEQQYLEEAEEYYRQSAKLLEKIDPQNSMFSWFMITMVKISQGKKAEGVEMLEKLRRDTTDEELRTRLDLVIINSAMRGDTLLFSPERLLELRDSIDYEKIIDLNKKSKNDGWSESPLFLYHSISGFVLSLNNRHREGLRYIEKGFDLIGPTTLLNVAYYQAASELAHRVGDSNLAFQYMEVYHTKSDSLHNAQREQQVKQVEAEFRQQAAHEVHLTRLQYQLYVWILLSLLLIVLVFYAIKAYRRRIQKQEQQIADFLSLIENYKQTTNQFTDQLRESNTRESIIKKYISSRRNMVQQIAATYYTYGDSNRFAEKMRDLALSEEMLADIVEMTNMFSHGAVEQLKRSFPNWTAKNYNLTSLIIAGFSAQEISVMLGMSLGGVYTLKSKIKRKILEAPIEIQEEFLPYFQ